jgi:hypothetical protein
VCVCVCVCVSWRMFRRMSRYVSRRCLGGTTVHYLALFRISISFTACLANPCCVLLIRIISHCFAWLRIVSHYLTSVRTIFTFFALLYNIPHRFTLFRNISRCLLSFCTDPHCLAVFRSVSYCFAVFSIVSDCFKLFNRFLHYGRSVSYYFTLFCMTSHFIVVFDGTISQHSTPLISQFRTASHKFAFVCNYVALFRIIPHQFTLFILHCSAML